MLESMLLVLYVEREKPFLDVFVSLSSDHTDFIYRRAGNADSSYATHSSLHSIGEQNH